MSTQQIFQGLNSLLVVLFSVCLVMTTVSCSTSRTTHTTTTTQVEGVDTVDTDTDTVVTERTTTEEYRDADHSILGSFFIFVGNVVAFPFRVIGSVFDAIF